MRFNVLHWTFSEGMNCKHVLLNWGLKIKIERCPIISGIVVSWKKKMLNNFNWITLYLISNNQQFGIWNRPQKRAIMLMPNKLCTPAKEISTFIHSSIQYLKTDLMQMHIFPSALTSSVASSRFPKYLQVKTKSKEKRKKIILPIDIKMIMLLFFF